MGLTPEQKKSFQENGFILLDNIFTNDEIQEMSDAYDQVFDLKKSQDSNMEAAWDGNWKTSTEKKTVRYIYKSFETLLVLLHHIWKVPLNRAFPHTGVIYS